MADIKTVTLNNEETRVSIERRHCHIRNLGGEMIYASLKPGIVPDADGVLGIPAGTKDALINTDGYVYLNGTGKVQLVGSEYADGILGGLAGNISEKVAAEVAKIVAGAPEDFDTLKEISDWITSHSESAAAMNKDIKDLKSNKADKTAIPTDYAYNKVLTTLDDVNNPDLKSGIYSVEQVSMTFPGDITSTYYMLITNKHRETSGFGVQIAIPHDSGEQYGAYYRTAKSGVWSGWTSLADGGNATTLDGLHANEIASNPNLLINPDFRINQRGKGEYVGVGYTLDHWYSNSPSNIVHSDGTIQLSGAGRLYQLVEHLSAGTYTLSASDLPSDIALSIGKSMWVFEKPHTFTLDTDTDNFLIGFIGNIAQDTISNPFRPSFIKLEKGSIATPFVPPDPAVELLKCQRYYQIRSVGDITEVDMRPSMATRKDVKLRVDGNYEYIAEI